MRLKSISYIERQGTLQEWCLETLSFAQRMLIVGRNSAGKSRSLSVTSGLAKHLIGAMPVGLGAHYVATFDLNGQKYVYELEYRESAVVHERIEIDDIERMERGPDGIGKIFAEKIDGGTNIDFQLPPSMLAAVAKRDAIQHSFVEPLSEWANSLRYYQFGGIVQGALAIFIPMGMPVDERDQNATVAIFREGVKLFGDPFVESIKNDLAVIDYEVESIALDSPVSVRFMPGMPPPMSINVKEKGLNGITDQIGMSAGMFRVLALFIHVNFAQFKGSASTVLIDDVGEGLDFDRSCRLIELLRANTASNSLCRQTISS